MTDQRRKEILKRIQKRKQLNQRKTDIGVDVKPKRNQIMYPAYDETHDFSWFSSSEGVKSGRHPLFNKDVFMFKLLLAAILVLSVAISFKIDSPQFKPVRQVVSTVMNREFQFAAISDWYEDTFGKPLALFPEIKDKTNDIATEDYALPANGAVILENFDTNSQGVVIQTDKDAFIESIQDGTVIFAGSKEEFGNTVIIQHSDNTETWYGQLGDIQVKVYDKVKAGDAIGTVKQSENEGLGEFYFAIKQGEKFIDPVQVIKFE